MLNPCLRIGLRSCSPFKQSYCNIFQINRKTSPENKDENFALQHCLDLVKRNDHEGYLCTLRLNNDERRDAFALRAFNAEIARCNNNISEDHIAKLRLQFWCDAVDQCFLQKGSYVSDHPVLQELQRAIARKKLSKFYLKRLVTARQRPVSQAFATLAEMEGYADQAFTSLLHLLIECKEIKNLNVDHVASHLGKAQGIATLLRAIPYKGRRDAVNIPQNILKNHNVSPERIVNQKLDDKEAQKCIFDVASRAYEHLQLARELEERVPSSARKVFLPAVATERYLERLRRANFRLTDQSVMQRDHLLPMSLYWHEMRSKY